jgi:hypothetical protein
MLLDTVYINFLYSEHWKGGQKTREEKPASAIAINHTKANVISRTATHLLFPSFFIATG